MGLTQILAFLDTVVYWKSSRVGGAQAQFGTTPYHIGGTSYDIREAMRYSKWAPCGSIELPDLSMSADAFCERTLQCSCSVSFPFASMLWRTLQCSCSLSFPCASVRLFSVPCLCHDKVCLFFCNYTNFSMKCSPYFEILRLFHCNCRATRSKFCNLL